MTDLECTEEIATLTYRSTTHRILIGPDRQTGQWCMCYLLGGQDVNNPQATCTEGKSREDILKKTTRFMIRPRTRINRKPHRSEACAMSIESTWSETQWANYLNTSSDLDDQSLAARLRLVHYLKAKGGRLNQREEQMLSLLQAMNKPELDFLRETTDYRINNDRPAMPRWHWPQTLLELYRDAIRDGLEW